MPTVLLLDAEEERARTTMRRLRTSLPMLRVERVGSALEFRYAVVTRAPDVAVMAEAIPDHTKLMWEITALEPSVKTVAICNAHGREHLTESLGGAVSAVVEEADVVAAVAACVGLACKPNLARPDGLPRRPERVSPEFDRHRMKNRLAGLLAGLHAMAAELRATAPQTERVPEVADEYVDRLVDVVGDLCAMVAVEEGRASHERHG